MTEQTVDHRALLLRRAGATPDQIATQLGLSSGTEASEAVRRAVAGMAAETALEALILELDRLDALTLALWTKASSGDQAAVDTVLRIMDRRSRVMKDIAALPTGREESKVDQLQERREARRRASAEGREMA